jgi:pilus assembly protein CpaB
MRSLRGLVMIGIALILGLAAAFLAARLMLQQTNVSTAKLAVATVDMNVGQRISKDQVRLIEWPTGNLPSGAFATVEELDGRVTKIAIQRDEPMLEARLAPVGAKGGLSAVIAEGKRAITVRVNDVVGVAGYALPGNFVDVIVNTREEANQRTGQEERALSKIVLEKILVLAVGQEAGRDDTKPKVVNAVTLEVTPMDAEKIDLARSVGTLSLVLRNQIDAKGASGAGATKDSLLGITSVKRPEPPKQEAPKAAPPVARQPAPAPPVMVQAAPPAPPPLLPPKPKMVCVDALVGGQRLSECFTPAGNL